MSEEHKPMDMAERMMTERKRVMITEPPYDTLSDEDKRKVALYVKYSQWRHDQEVNGFRRVMRFAEWLKENGYER